MASKDHVREQWGKYIKNIFTVKHIRKTFIPTKEDQYKNEAINICSNLFKSYTIEEQVIILNHIHSEMIQNRKEHINESSLTKERMEKNLNLLEKTMFTSN